MGDLPEVRYNSSGGTSKDRQNRNKVYTPTSSEFETTMDFSQSHLSFLFRVQNVYRCNN
jgi:hypothetical protein